MFHCLNREMFSHPFISEGVKYNKKVMTNKYVCVNDQTCSAKIYDCVIIWQVLFFSAFSGSETNSRSVKLQNIYPVYPRANQENRVLV